MRPHLAILLPGVVAVAGTIQQRENDKARTLDHPRPHIDRRAVDPQLHSGFIDLVGAIQGDAQIVLHGRRIGAIPRSEEHTSELQSLMRISYAVFCLKKKTTTT